MLIERDWLVARLVMVTLAPATTPPDGSVTVPVSAPVLAVCAPDAETKPKNTTKQIVHSARHHVPDRNAICS